ncbi:MAG: hypothetical protein PGN25_17520 [Methylorubrum populi]
MMNIVDLAIACKMDRIDMEADDLGRYIWPTMGFLPATDEIWTKEVARLAGKRLERLWLGGHLTSDDHEDLRHIIGRLDRMAARSLIVQDIMVPGPSPRGGEARVPVGKVLLLSSRTTWNASLDLKNDQEGLDLFEAYKRKHHVSHPAPR